MRTEEGNASKDVTREDWNEDWAIVDGAGYFDVQETPDGGLAFVESNKLTVRYHEIPPGVVGIMKDQLGGGHSGSMGGSAVFKWSGNPGWHRSPVLPDLRAGGGFTLVCWVKLTALPGAAGSSTLLVDGTRAVSGSLDEEEAEDITKGFTVTYEVGGGFRLFVTDGFHTEFEFTVLETAEEREYYCDGRDSMKIAFIMDGGPKV